MKKFWSTAEFTRQQEIRRRKAQRRASPGSVRARRFNKPKYKGEWSVAQGNRAFLLAPTVLSVFDNPTETLRFCEELHRFSRIKGQRIFMDLSQVERISSDALLLIKAVTDEGLGFATSLSGNLPQAPLVASKIKESGFFHRFAKPPADLPPPQGMIRRRENLQVDSAIAAELVEFAMQNADVSEDVAEASYKSLVELMANTHNHASAVSEIGQGGTGQRRWFATVWCQNQIAYFNFVDLGVGILGSFAVKDFVKKIGVSVYLYGREKLLTEVFHGRIGASASMPGRGFGMTDMRQRAENNVLPELRVLTGSIVGFVATQRFQSIGDARLRGTMFRWTTSAPADES